MTTPLLEGYPTGVNGGWALAPLRLQGGGVTVRTMTATDTERTAESIDDPRGWMGKHWKLDTPEKIAAMLVRHLKNHEQGITHPMVYEADGEIAGITRYLRLDADARTLEIGGTWVASRWRRTRVNTQVKFLLLRHAFEALGAERVEFRVDYRNFVSQTAVMRLGATLEGKLRGRQIYPGGDVRDGYLFSIVRPDWERVRARLLALMENAPSLDKNELARELRAPRLLIREYAPSDAGAFFSLVESDREGLTESFPKTVAALRSPAQAEAYVLELRHQRLLRSSFAYGVFAADSGRLIGHLWIKNVDWGLPSCELGYFLESESRGMGLGRELVGAAADELLKRRGFARVALRVLETNAASLGLARALGFEREGILRGAFRTGRGEVKDVVSLSRTR